jgi:beta-lactamase regulating signal transducer with metallopeptidase domain
LSALSGFGSLQLSPFVLALLAKGTLVLLFASVLNLALRRASASARHMVWLLTLATLLALPVLTALLPRWDLPVLPRTAVPARPARLEPALGPVQPLMRFVAAMPAPASMPSMPDDIAPVFSRSPQDRVQYVPNQPSSITWQSWLVAIWIAGVVLGLLRFAAGTVNVWNTTRHAQRIDDDLWLAQLDEAARGQSLRRDVVLRRTSALSVPVVWGWRRPVVLVPVDSDFWSDDRRRAILQHELAHVARYDCVAQTIAALAQALYWPHPLVWWAVRQMRREAERACDDRVLASGTGAPEYAEYLLDAVRRLRAAPWLSASTSAVVERTHLGDRLLALLDDRLTRTAVSRRTVALATLSALGAAAAVAALQPSVRAAAAEALRAAAGPVASAPASPASPTPIAGRAAESLALSGTVKTPDGKPAAGALVEAWSRDDPFAPGPRSDRTDAKGEFHLPVSTRVPRVMRVQLVPFAPQTVERMVPGTPIVVTLTPGSFVAGIVRDAATRQPIEGARVAPARGWSTTDSDPGPMARTDSSGRFRLQGLPLGASQIEVVAAGFGSQALRVTAGRGDIQFFLNPGTEITGSVIDSRGRPVRGALASADDGVGLQARSAPPTDERGRFSVGGLVPGTYRLVVRHPEFAPLLQAGIVVELGAPARVDVRLEPALRIVGRLVDADEKPVTGRVFLQAFNGADVPMSLAAQVATAVEAGGGFVLNGVPRGTLALGIRPRGHLPTRMEVSAPAKEAVLDLGNIRLESGLIIRGSVRDRQGAPIANAKVSTRQENREALAASEADGTFILNGLPEGPRRVSVSAEGFAPAELEADAGGRSVKVVLDAEAVVAGTVVDESGRSLDTFRALLYTEGPERSGRLTATPQGDDGRFRITAVPPGTYVLDIQAGSYADRSLPAVHAAAGQVTDLGRIVLASGGLVRGSVVDATGAAIAGALVSLDDSRSVFRRVRFGGSGEEREAWSDADGRFELRGLPYGAVPLKATHPRFAPSANVEIQVPTGTDAAEVRFTLLAGGRIEGTAVARDGQPFAGFVLTFPSFVQSPVRADGTFALDHMATGRRTVHLMAGSAGTFDGVLSKEIDVRDGETTTVDFRVRDVLVSGTVTRGGKPVAQQEVRVSPSNGAQMKMGMSALAVPAAAGPQRLKGVTAADGSYALLAPEAGRYSASVTSLAEPAGRSSGVAAPELDVPDADSVRFDIALPAALLMGSVVEQSSGRPIAEARVKAVPPGGASRGGGATTGADGRFRLALDPGTYDIRIEATKFVALATDLVIGEETLERAFELARGVTVKGQAVASGQGVGGATVAALAGGRTIARSESLPGGAFELSVLSDEPYQLLAAHDRGFALASAPTGAEPVRLRLDPGTLVSLRFRDQDGGPVSKTFVRFDLVRWNQVQVGAAQWGPYGYAITTNTEGVLDIMLPRGDVELTASAQSRKLRGSVHLSIDGVPVSMDVTLQRTD